MQDLSGSRCFMHRPKIFVLIKSLVGYGWKLATSFLFCLKKTSLQVEGLHTLSEIEGNLEKKGTAPLIRFIYLGPCGHICQYSLQNTGAVVISSSCTAPASFLSSNCLVSTLCLYLIPQGPPALSPFHALGFFLCFPCWTALLLGDTSFALCTEGASPGF